MGIFRWGKKKKNLALHNNIEEMHNFDPEIPPQSVTLSKLAVCPESFRKNVPRHAVSIAKMWKWGALVSAD